MIIKRERRENVRQGLRGAALGIMYQQAGAAVAVHRDCLFKGAADAVRISALDVHSPARMTGQ